jgi:hypothetical protein
MLRNAIVSLHLVADNTVPIEENDCKVRSVEIAIDLATLFLQPLPFTKL